MPSKRKFLAVYVPGCLLLGFGTLGLQISEHGMSSGVITGLIAGGAFSAVIFVAALPGLRRPLPERQARKARDAARRTRGASVAAGTTVGVVAAAAGLSTGESGPTLLCACGMLFILLTPVAAAAVVMGRGLYSPAASRSAASPTDSGDIV